MSLMRYNKMTANRTGSFEIVFAVPVLAWRKASATLVITRPGFRPGTSENKIHNGTFGEVIGYWLEDVGYILDRFTRSYLCRCVHVGQLLNRPPLSTWVNCSTAPLSKLQDFRKFKAVGT